MLVVDPSKIPETEAIGRAVMRELMHMEAIVYRKGLCGENFALRLLASLRLYGIVLSKRWVDVRKRFSLFRTAWALVQTIGSTDTG